MTKIKIFMKFPQSQKHTESKSGMIPKEIPESCNFRGFHLCVTVNTINLVVTYIIHHAIYFVKHFCTVSFSSQGK